MLLLGGMGMGVLGVLGVGGGVLGGCFWGAAAGWAALGVLSVGLLGCCSWG